LRADFGSIAARRVVQRLIAQEEQAPAARQAAPSPAAAARSN
jgi:hypothetical protein